MSTFSDSGARFIAQIEGSGKPALRAYWDENGYAIGFGNHTYEDGTPVRQGDTIAADRAYGLLRAYVNRECMPAFRRNVRVDVKQHQLDAVMSLLYNGGPGVLTSTGLHKAINNNPGDTEKIKTCFYKIRKGKSTGVSLIDRRNKELDLYFNANYNTAKSSFNGTNFYGSGAGANESAPVQNSYFIRFCNDKIILNLADFIEYWKLDITPDALLAYEDNANAMFTRYKKHDKDKYKKGIVELIEYGTPLKIPNRASTVTSAYQLHQNIEMNKAYNAFMEAEVKQLLYNPSYRRLNTSQSGIGSGSVYKRNEKVSILLWSRALSPDESRLIDISEFVESVNTGNGNNGGNFMVTLPKIVYNVTNGKVQLKTRLDGEDYYVVKQLTHTIEDMADYKIVGYNKVDDNNFLRDTNEKYFKRTNSFFTDLVQKNDIVFISYEKIDYDKNKGREKAEKLAYMEDGIKWVDNTCLPDNVFTMIGLVDNAATVTNNSGVDTTVTLTGRDFNKVLIEDGVQFFVITYGLKNFGSLVRGADAFARERYVITPYDGKATDFENNLSIISNQTIQDTGFNFFTPHTIGEFLTYIFSKMTHQVINEGQLFRAYKNKTFIVSSDDTEYQNAGVNQSTIEYKTVEAAGIWKIVKLIIDPSIANRKILDLGFVNDSGSLINFIRKVCQKPFVEFFSDVYGDKFYFVARKPPFSESSYKSLFTINVYEDEVFDDNLAYSDEAYTYYQLNPLGSIIKDPVLFMNFLPAVILPEYLKIFGNRIMKVDSNYLDFDITENNQTTNTIEQLTKQHRQDMDFLLETTAYLPFTRLGKINMRGTPLIKKGMNIRYMATGELFHVEGVTQAANFGKDTTERMTTIEVSHGIVEKHYEKYFRLVNLFRVFGEKNDLWKVNKSVFDFLMEKRQNQ